MTIKNYKIQIYNIIILFNNIALQAIKKNQNSKLIIQNYKYLLFMYFIKFYNAQIKFNLYDIILEKKSFINNIFLIKDHNINSISFQNIIGKKLSLKK